ncbi:hypothetical protein [Streptomyces sp. NPDC056105]|uniref:hypothetical protein n=1 Tax=Streptomyces sp. NPDC056105 TaxID=3345714 RepID=UPI0035DF361A
MDSGLAAVLGAAVGAIGTGSAAIATALLGRSQTRLQVQAEHHRILRDARRVAYARLAEALAASSLAVQQCERTLLIIHTVVPVPETNWGEHLLRAEEEFAEASRLHAAIKGPQALVSIEGPEEVSLSAAKASSDIVDQRHAVIQVIRVMAAGGRADDLLAGIEGLRAEAIRSQHAYQKIASRFLSNLDRT